MWIIFCGHNLYRHENVTKFYVDKFMYTQFGGRGCYFDLDGIGMDACEGVVCILNQWLGSQWTCSCGHEMNVSMNMQYVS